MSKKWLTPYEAAKRINSSEATLSRRRSQGKGPPFYKFGRRYWYDIADLDDYIASHRIVPKT